MLVTGATGFIGRYVVERLLADREAVRILIPRSASVPDEWQGQVECTVGDLSDLARLTLAVSGTTAVYHLAGEIRNSQLFTAVNVEGTQNLLNACVAEGQPRVLHVSSVGVIGAQRSGTYDERSACQPRNSYEASKWQGEQIAREFQQRRLLRVTVVRPTIVFGPRVLGPADSFLSWLRAVQRGRFRHIGSGSGFANYVYVEDVAAACVALMQRDDTVGEVYHVADPTTVGELVTQMARCLNAPQPDSLPAPIGYLGACALSFVGCLARRPMPLTINRVRALTSRIRFNSEKLRAVMTLPVGWQQGVARTVAHYREIGLL